MWLKADAGHFTDIGRLEQRLSQHAGIPEQRTHEILQSHLIEPESLFSENVEQFFERRQEALIGLIEAATGKRVGRMASQDEPIGDEVDDDSDRDANGQGSESI